MEKIKMSKDAAIRVSVPGRIYDLFWNDEEFYREISQNKKATTTSNKFPKYDQWCADDGLHMAFALAGYSASDIKISVKDNEIVVSSFSEKQEVEQEVESEDGLEFSERKALPSVSYGIIVRGIARRNFKTKFILHQMFDTIMTKATMKNGLLEIVVPRKKEETNQRFIEIKEN